LPEVNVEPQKTPAQESAVELPRKTGEHAPSVRRITTPPEGFRRCAMRVLRDSSMVLVYGLEPSAKESGPSLLVFESPGRSARLEQ